jgi:hypothetical protein
MKQDLTRAWCRSASVDKGTSGNGSKKSAANYLVSEGGRICSPRVIGHSRPQVLQHHIMETESPFTVVSGTVVPTAPQKGDFGGTRNLTGILGKEAGSVSHRLRPCDQEMTLSEDSHVAQTRMTTAPCSSTYVGGPSVPAMNGCRQRAQRTDWWAAPRWAARQLADSIISCHRVTGGFFDFTRSPGSWEYQRMVVQKHHPTKSANSAGYASEDDAESIR